MNSIRRPGSVCGVLAAALLLVSEPLAGAPESPSIRTQAEVVLKPIKFTGIFDGSAAIGTGPRRFLAANDEDNLLRLYDTTQPGPPLAVFPLSAVFPGEVPDDEEIDIEGVARLGERHVWITSHGRNKNGKWRQKRHFLFSVEVDPDGGLRAAGKPYRRLAEVLRADPRFKDCGVADSIGDRKEDDPSLAPKVSGLNIESLSAAPNGTSLWVGLRNPRNPDGRAITFRITNPLAVLDEGATPQIDDPVFLDLEGRSLRSMEWSELHGCYLIIGGATPDKPGHWLYRWTKGTPEPVLSLTALLPKDFTPEGLALLPGEPRVLILSDDGELVCDDGKTQKEQADRDGTFFRGVWIDVPKGS